jgi:hypothetical protein
MWKVVLGLSKANFANPEFIPLGLLAPLRALIAPATTNSGKHQQ